LLPSFGLTVGLAGFAFAETTLEALFALLAAGLIFLFATFLEALLVTGFLAEAFFAGAFFILATAFASFFFIGTAPKARALKEQLPLATMDYNSHLQFRFDQAITCERVGRNELIAHVDPTIIKWLILSKAGGTAVFDRPSKSNENFVGSELEVEHGK